jgi:hypothetical protein
MALGGQVENAVGPHRSYQFMHAEGIEQVAIYQVDFAGRERLTQGLFVGDSRLDHMEQVMYAFQVLKPATAAIDAEYLHVGLCKCEFGQVTSREARDACN